MVQYAYTRTGSGILAPIVLIQLNQLSSASIKMLVDSGADWSLLHVDWLDRFGIQEADCQIVEEEGWTIGKAQFIVPPLKIDYTLLDPLGNPVKHVRQALAFLRPIQHPKNPFEGKYDGLLGSVGFFDSFNVSFDMRQGRFSVEP